MSRLKVYISSDSITRAEVSPIWSETLEYERERDKFFYRVKMRGEMVFGGAGKRADWLLFDPVVSDPTSCEMLTVEVERECGGSFSVFWTGEFSMLEAKVNHDECTLTAKPRALDDYTDFFKIWEDEVNVWSNTIIEALPYPEGAQLEIYEVVDGPFSAPAPANPAPLPLPPAEVGKWCSAPEDNGVYWDFPQWIQYTWYSRITLDGICVGGVPQPPDTSGAWTLLTDNCPTGSTWWRCPGLGTNPQLTLAPLRQGRDFNEILQDVMGGLTVVSDFFDINADATAPSNDAYDFAADHLHHLTIHQKSDAKRPFASDPALSSTWNISPKDLLESLETMFNVRWTIVGTTIRIEHASYWTAASGLDLTSEKYARVLEADETDRIGTENFYWMDDPVSDYFAGSPITYPCGTEVKDNSVKLFTTDLGEILHNDNNDSISDAGFALCATVVLNATQRIIIQDNRPLSWTQLHDALHRHERYWKDGSLNGQSVAFDTFRKVRKQPPFTFRYCCDTAFDPNDQITTSLGAGEVEKVEYNLRADWKKISLKY